MTEFEQVIRFNREILGIKARPHGLQTFDEARLSYTQMAEEAQEFLDAHQVGDLVGCIDACIDCMVFTMGILYKMGITEEEYKTIFKVVMDANMTKSAGQNASRTGFGSATDAVKPKEFVPPEHIIRDIISE